MRKMTSDARWQWLRDWSRPNTANDERERTYTRRALKDKCERKLGRQNKKTRRFIALVSLRQDGASRINQQNVERESKACRRSRKSLKSLKIYNNSRAEQAKKGGSYNSQRNQQPPAPPPKKKEKDGAFTFFTQRPQSTISSLSCNDWQWELHKFPNAPAHAVSVEFQGPLFFPFCTFHTLPPPLPFLVLFTSLFFFFHLLFFLFRMRARLVRGCIRVTEPTSTADGG